MMLLKHCLLVSFVFFALHELSAQTQPLTKKEAKLFNEHGHQRADDYYWLSNATDTNVIRHLEEENAYVKGYLKNTEDLQKTLFTELVNRIEQKYVSLPTKQNGYWYYVRYEEGKQYPYYARKKGTTTAKEQVMLDVPEMATAHQIFLVRGWKVSRDNRFLAYGIDTNGNRRSVLYIKDIESGRHMPESIQNTSGNYVWSNNGKALYYIVNDHTVRAYKVMRHLPGTDGSVDQEVYTEKDSTFAVNLYSSKDNSYLFISTGNGATSEAYYLDNRMTMSSPVLIQKRAKGILYYPSYDEGNIFHIYTNKDAINFKLVTAPIASPAAEQWKDLIPHRENALLENVEILQNFYVTQWKEKGLPQIKIFDRKKNSWSSVPFGQDAYVANMNLSTDDPKSDSIRYYFTSLSTPGTDYMYNLRTGQKKILKQQKVGGGFDAAQYETRRIWSTSKDGTKVPISLVYKKDKFQKDGSHPLYLYAYGSYGASSDPYFNPSVISLLDRGCVFAIAHIRGGQEMGRKWYEGAKVLTKKNTFTDFVDAAQFLVDEKYTSPDRLFANGVSAGGMLMGAAVNLRPDLFRGVIAEVPWMDVITDMYNPDLPLTTLEYGEWGDPNVKAEYDYMLSWSPMDNIKPAKFPAILATGGLHDTQVPYFSPAKWVARLRENNLGNQPILFKVNMGAGHGGESGRFERQKLTALKFAFVLDQLGWNEETKTFSNRKAF